MPALRVAIAGLGTVGAAVVDILQSRKDLIASRCSRDSQLVAISARDRNRDRGIEISNVTWFDDAVEMAKDADADLIIELIGGEEGVGTAP